MSAKEMTCMSCGTRKAYPDAFPNRAYAECWQCAFDAHIRRAHPEIARRIRKEAKRRARRLKRSEIEAAMTEAERNQALPPPSGAAMNGPHPHAAPTTHTPKESPDE